MAQIPEAKIGRIEFDDNSTSLIAPFFSYSANTQPKTFNTQLPLGPVRTVYWNRLGNTIDLLVPPMVGANMLTFPNDDWLVIPLSEPLFGFSAADNIKVGTASYFVGGIPPGAEAHVFQTGIGSGVNSNSLIIYPDATSVNTFLAAGNPYQFSGYMVKVVLQP
jgi:hypothetical protein